MTPPNLSRRVGGMLIALSALAIVVPAAPVLAAGGWSSEKVTGNGQIKSETRALGRFTGVSLGLPGSTELRIGNTESVTIETDDNLLPLIETVIENGTLKIRAAKRNLDLDTRRLKIVVQAKRIDSLALGGSGSIDADALRGAKVMINIGGSGNINVKGVDSDELSVALGGSGDLTIGGGAAKKVSVSIAGSGDVDMGKLQSVDASVSIAGSGDAKIAVRDELRVTIAGSGDVNYYGDPKLRKSVVGSGSANRMGGTAR